MKIQAKNPENSSLNTEWCKIYLPQDLWTKHIHTNS